MPGWKQVFCILDSVARRSSLGVYFCTAFSAVIVLESQMAGTAPRFDPGNFFTPAQQARLRAGVPVITIPDSSNGEVALVGAVRTNIGADRLVAWSRHPELMYAGAFAPVGGRFSNPPRIEDLNALQLSADDLEALRSCHPGDCSVKLAPAEMASIRTAIDTAGPNWRPAAIEAFRRMLVARATAFLSGGLGVAPPYHDHRRPVSPAAEFDQIVAGPERAAVLPVGADEYMRAFPRARRPNILSLLFWSKNVASGAREVVSVTHMGIFNDPSGSDHAVVAEAQVYASHYLDASLAYIVLVGDPPDRYLAYLRRTKVDVVRGTFGGIVRNILERRVRAEAPKLIDNLRRKLEKGGPPSAASPSLSR